MADSSRLIDIIVAEVERGAIKKKTLRSYQAFQAMRTRVKNTNYVWHHNYSHLNIDPRWESFSKFLTDMGECPPGLTLERIDNSKGYGPDNCRWDTRRAQARNRKTNKLTLDDARAIRHLRSQGWILKSIAGEYGVSIALVSKICRNQVWIDDGPVNDNR